MFKQTIGHFIKGMLFLFCFCCPTDGHFHTCVRKSLVILTFAFKCSTCNNKQINKELESLDRKR